jgi:hypothetical protein
MVGFKASSYRVKEIVNEVVSFPAEKNVRA